MRRNELFGKSAALAACALTLSACVYVSIDRDVADPRSYFDRALREIRRIERSGRGRGHEARELCVLAYDGRDGELVRVEAPLALIHGVLSLGLEDLEHDRTFRKWRDRHGLDRRVRRRLAGCEPGLVVEINEDRERLLVWLR